MRVANMTAQAFYEDEGKILSAVYFQGCNKDCKWCHNPELKPMKGGIEKTPDEVFAEITKDNFLSDGVLLSGGEPTIQEGIVELCCHFVGIGWRVVLNTNGTKPGVIDNLPEGMKVTLDVKTPKKEYGMDSGTIDFCIQALQRFNESEIRITWSPSYLTESNVVEMVRWIRSINKESPIYLQPYKWTTKMPPMAYIQPNKEQVAALIKRVQESTGHLMRTRYV